MKHRKLRIAWSVAWGIVAMLLILLWVRSYWWAEVVLVPLTDSRAIAVGSISGGVTINPWLPTAYRVDSSRMYRSQKYDGIPSWLDKRIPGEQLAIVAQHEGYWAELKRHPRPIRFGILNHAFLSPYFVLVGCATVLAVLPWFVHRFSLRTLLIATTLVAVGLGWIVWAAR